MASHTTFIAATGLIMSLCMSADAEVEKPLRKVSCWGILWLSPGISGNGVMLNDKNPPCRHSEIPLTGGPI